VTAALTGSAAPAAASAIVVTSKTWLWYVTRSTGLVALVLLTASLALGLLSGVRWQRPGWPRFVTSGLHRNVSVLACAAVVVHIVTTLADGFVPIYVQDAVLPWGSAYRPLWLGLGAVSFDLMLALIVTSMVRTRMSYRAWRTVHWAAYLSWPAAVLHGLGAGTDTPVRWVLLLTLACVALIAGLAGWRLAYGWPDHALARVAAGLALVLALIAGLTWLQAGPLAPGWAHRAGTAPAQGPR
jgi:DMSO/TMAO reductase YedYZ heme-binding membrane subunit